MNLFFNPKDFNIEIDLPASKSIHNRVIILNALYDLNLEITNPSNSGDSLLLQSF
jgi:5-enolpyruvylshikimate-3-phosphate synthase